MIEINLKLFNFRAGQLNRASASAIRAPGLPYAALGHREFTTPNPINAVYGTRILVSTVGIARVLFAVRAL